MAHSAVGVIFTNIQDKNIPELSSLRTMASIPFAGRYRLIDFALSNLVNAGITTVGIVTRNNYQSLLDHLGSGKEWDLARKDGGIILLSPYSNETDAPYKNRLEALKGITGFLQRRKEDYVVLYDGDGVARLDIEDVVRFHEESHADFTLVYKETDSVESHYFITLSADETGRINSLQDAVQSGYSSFGRDILSRNVESMRIFGYKFNGYYAGITSLPRYFKYSMEMLDKNVRDELFGARDIYTKVRDSAPSKYIDGAAHIRRLHNRRNGGKQHSFSRSKGGQGKRRAQFGIDAGDRRRLVRADGLRYHRQKRRNTGSAASRRLCGITVLCRQRKNSVRSRK